VNSVSYKTSHLNELTAQKEWFVVDASQAPVGRLATRIANVIRGKHKPTYSPHVDGGDFVIVINAKNLRFTGKKMSDKVYTRHTGYPGGQRFSTPKSLIDQKSGRIVEHAVKGMLPKSRLGRRLFTRLFVYEGAEHPHAAQQPKELKLN
jgi:large subunit ribosomal protein L13